jgi:succinoglycan biosynthesis transport protein ExoP
VAIANTLVNVFIDYNNNLQNERYQESKQTLQIQIAQVEKQISDLQSEMERNTTQTQKEQTQEQIKTIETQLNSTEEEIIQIENQLAYVFPTPEVTNTPIPSWIIPTATPIPVPTPTLSFDDEVKYKELQNRLDQLSELRSLYKQVYANLLVSGVNSENNTTRQEQIQTTLALYQQIYTTLLNNLENINLSQMRSTPNVVQIEEARTPIKPIQPQPTRDALLGLVSGVILMGIVAFVIEYTDDTLKTPEDISSYLHQSVLGLVGRMGKPHDRDDDGGLGVFVVENPLMPITEAFRTIRTNIEFASVSKPIRTLMITSTSPSEGKSTLSVNLAAILAQGNRKVVLIDADLRRPSIHRFFGIANLKGLSDLFRNHTEVSSVITSWGEPSIEVITSGGLPPNPAELLASARLDMILEELKERSDIVILDTPPAIVADPIALSAKVDGVLLVIEPGKTKIGAAQVLLEQLDRAGARVVGVVLNSLSRRQAGYYYSKYRYYSSYYYSRSNGSYFSSNGKTSKRKRLAKSGQEQGELEGPSH